jgi:hypothetical protein
MLHPSRHTAGYVNGGIVTSISTRRAVVRFTRTGPPAHRRRATAEKVS